MKKKSLFILVAIFLLFSCAAVAFAADGSGASLFGGLQSLVSFLKRLIVPAPNYFHNKVAALSKHTIDRLGGVAYLYLMLNHFFNELKNVPPVEMTFSIPDNYFFRGYKGFYLDFLTSAKPYLKMIRNILTPSFCIFTAITCYHKLRTFFKE